MTSIPNETLQSALDRRRFLATSSLAGAGAMALAQSGFGQNAPANPGELKIGLIGCGGRGSGAADQTLSVPGSVKLHAMGDMFEDRLKGSLNSLQTKHSSKVDVPQERQFTGFDAVDKVLASGVDMVVLATPPGFRPFHFAKAVEAGKNIFLEKPVATDAPGVRMVLEAAKKAKEKGLKIVAGLQRRYQNNYIEAFKKIKEGVIGDIVSANVYWNDSGVWVKDRKPEDTEMEYQLRNWYYFNWICGDHIVEQHVHNLDVANWFIDALPVSAWGMGGRQIRTGKEFGEIFDHHMVEFTYPNGVIVTSTCRHQKDTKAQVREEFVGTKGRLKISGGGSYEVFDTKGKQTDRYRGKEDPNPYQTEHDALHDAIRNNKEINNAEYVATSTMTAIMGRMCTYSGKELTWDQALNSQVSIMPKTFDKNADMPSKPDKDGFYPIPTPGVTKVI